MLCLFAAPVAKLRKLNFALYFLLVFSAPVVNALARGTLKFNKIWLSFCHTTIISKKRKNRKSAKPRPGVEPGTFPLPWECSAN